MIDFRYHLVSLAAVLIALSIGIVLGAGPLNDNIGSTLSGEVTKLRQEKEELRRQAKEDQRGLEARDAYDEQTLPGVVGDRLVERTATVVVLPEAADDDVQEARDVLEESGASVADTVEVDADWAAAGDASADERDRTGDGALRDLGVDAEVPDGAQTVDQALAVVVTGRERAGSTERVERSARDAAWTRLRDAGLVEGPAQAPAAADLVVVVGGPVAAESADDTSGSVDRAAEATAATWVALTHLVQTHADGTVLAAPEAEEGSADASPVTMARTQGSLAEGVSTVDDPDLPMGRAAIVLALDEQLDGGSGHYGIGSGADAPVPEGA